MISQYEVPSLLKQEMPHLAGKLYPSKVSLQIYSSINYFSDYTKHAEEEHNFNLARKCFALAEKLYREGDRLVQLLIETSFIYSFSLFMPKDRAEKLMVRPLIPEKLYSVYMKQVMQTGC
jgi:hypothetical protein